MTKTKTSEVNNLKILVIIVTVGWIVTLSLLAATKSSEAAKQQEIYKSMEDMNALLWCEKLKEMEQSK